MALNEADETVITTHDNSEFRLIDDQHIVLNELSYKVETVTNNVLVVNTNIDFALKTSFNSYHIESEDLQKY